MVKKSQFTRPQICVVNHEGENRYDRSKNLSDHYSSGYYDNPSARVSPSTNQNHNIDSPQGYQPKKQRLQPPEDNICQNVQKLASAGISQIKRRSVDIDKLNVNKLMQIPQKSGAQTLKTLNPLSPDGNARVADKSGKFQMKSATDRHIQGMGFNQIRLQEQLATSSKNIKKLLQSISSSSSSLEEYSNNKRDLYGLMKIDDSFEHSDSGFDVVEHSILLSSPLMQSLKDNSIKEL